MAEYEQQTGLLMVISAPSGAGKTTLCNALKERFPELKESISYTTRRPRGAEQDGVDYHFIAVERFQQMIAEGCFAEWARVHDNYYGTAIAALQQASQQGVDILLDIDCQGAKTLKDHNVEGLFVFVVPPDMQELQRRLEARGTDSEEVITRRLERAIDEIRESRWYDYIIINDDLEDAKEALSSIVIAARHRSHKVFGQISKKFDI